MKSIIRIVVLFLLGGFLGHTFASNADINITVKGYHNDNERSLESNSVLFSGDSFQLIVEAKDSLYIYAFLVDSSNKVTLLNENNSTLLNQNQTVHFPSDINNWYQLDEKIGNETLLIASSQNKLDVVNIESPEDIIRLRDNGANLETFIIKHLGAKLAMRGLDMDSLGNENLIDSFEISSSIERTLSPILANKSSSETILQIMSNTKELEAITSSKTRGVKEVRIFEDSAPSVVYIKNPNSIGTGVLISNDGLVFTNSHVVGDSKKVAVYFMPKHSAKYSGENYMAGMVVNNNKQADLALIKLLKTPVGVRPLLLADSSTIKIGQDVHAIGHPGDAAEWTYTRGYIGQILKDFEWGYNDGIKRKAKMVIQSQTPIMGGNSGGPLLNDDGEVIGVNSFGGEYEGANYAVSVKDLKLFLNEKFSIPKAPAATAETKHASKYWEANVIKVARSDYNEDGELDIFFFLDEDKTGIWETVLIEIAPNNELVIIEDWDEDGKWNQKIINTNNNPRPDFHIFDRNGDGKADYFGYDDDEDGIVDRYEEA
jgi:S1-C subfamily serine protease